MNTKIFKAFCLIIIQFILILSLTSCEKEKQGKIERSGFMFDTFVTISLLDGGSQEVLDDCFSLCQNYENLFSINKENSDLYNIKHANGKQVIVSPETMELIKYGISLSIETEGKFDITIEPAYELWDFENEATNSNNPTEDMIIDAICHINYKKIIIDETTSSVTLESGMAISFGALAKGYIADKIKEYLIASNVKSAIINLGGNVQTIGHKSGDQDFRIGIKRPFSETGEVMTDVSISDESVVTAGIYERFFKKGDSIFHHIIDPSTAKSAETDLYSATIICPSSLKADAYSTICILKGKEDAIKFISEHDDVKAILIDNNYEITRINM